MLWCRHHILSVVIAASVLGGCTQGDAGGTSAGSKTAAPASSAAELGLASPRNTDPDTAGGRRRIRVCVDEADVSLFAFKTNGGARGIYVDMIREVLDAVGYDAEFHFIPWRRCTEHELKVGMSDTAISAAYSDARAEYAWFPDDARELGPKCKSPSALTCNGPVLLVPADSTYRFTGDYATIPQPVRVTFGYAQATEFRERGLKVDEGPGDPFNVAKMLRDGTGSVLIWKLSIGSIDGDPRLKGRYKLVDGFADLSDGFLPFSHRGQLTKAEVEKIWSELKRRRADPKFVEGIMARYGPDALPKRSDTKP